MEGNVHKLAEREAFITFKDHKENFISNPKCRLINPAKSEIGMVSKIILQKINSAVAKAIKLNQWRSTQDVLKWFKAIDDKENAKFIKFDVVEFYPSITEKLLNDSIKFAQTVCKIEENEIHIIKHACKSVLFYKGSTWVKKGKSGLFDITMGSYHGAEVCELVGLLILSKLAQLLGHDNVGLYRDDGLAIIKNSAGKDVNNACRRIKSTFKKLGLEITTEPNLRATNFLDVTLENGNDTFYPYRKPGNTPLYVNKKSNHPPNILKQIPVMIEKRITSLSGNQREFDKASPAYESALRHSGYTRKMSFAGNGHKQKPPAKKQEAENNLV